MLISRNIIPQRRVSKTSMGSPICCVPLFTLYNLENNFAFIRDRHVHSSGGVGCGVGAGAFYPMAFCIKLKNVDGAIFFTWSDFFPLKLYMKRTHSKLVLKCCFFSKVGGFRCFVAKCFPLGFRCTRFSPPDETSIFAKIN